jgi:uncharacterized protein YlxW (UPF0749 family)
LRLSPPPNTFSPFLLLVFLALGFFGAIYYVEHEGRFVKPIYSTAEILRTRNLFHRIRHEEYRNANLESQIAELKLQTMDSEHKNAVSKTESLARFIGILPEEGSGVEVTLKDSLHPEALGENLNSGIVHDIDLVQVVNELRASGAHAIAINNHRVSTLTAISCNGSIVILNGTRLTSPFVIQAIGNPEKMEKAMLHKKSYLEELRRFDIGISVLKKPVSVPATAQPLTAHI